MKLSASLQLAAAGIASLASVAKSQSLCAVNCFQSVITEHPPLTCTEDSMYLCFCKSQSLQGYFVECVYDECSDDADNAIAFGVNLCSELGAPITVPPRPATTSTTSSTSSTSSTSQQVEPTSDPEPTSADPVEVSSTVPEAPTDDEAPASATSASESDDSPASESDYAESSYAGPTYAEPSKSETASAVQPPSETAPVVQPPSETPADNSPTPSSSEPTHVVVNKGMSVMVAPGLLIGAAAVAAALQLL